MLLTPSASFAADVSVNSLRLGIHPDKTRAVMELSGPTEYRVFTLQNPARIVIDLPSFDWKAGNVHLPPGGLIRFVRKGPLEPGISRIVLESDAAVNLQSAFILPRAGNNSDRLVIDFTKAGAGFSPATQRTFGSLKGGSVASSTASAPSTVPARPYHGDNKSHTLQLPPQPKPIVSAGTTTRADVTPIPAYRGKKHVIVIDPGHGGQDPGALGAGGHKEKNVTLAAAQELKKQLEDTGRYTVHLTRDKDVFIKLPDRVKIGRRLGADLFISLHADSIDKPNVHGASIYTLSNTASDAQTAKLAARENRADLIAGVDLSHEDKEVADILIDLAMRDTMNQSKFFANTVVQKAGAHGIDLLDRPHRFAGFAVLKAADIPSVLIEMGFMSNKKEVSQLTSPAYRQKIARSIAAGIDVYFAKVQKNAEN